MKKTSLLLAALLSISTLVLQAQPGGRGGGMGGPPSGPQFGGHMKKIFGENSKFSAEVEYQTKDAASGDTTMPGKLAFLDGKSRFEMDMGKMQNSKMPPGAAEQMKAMGMDRVVFLTLPEKKTSYLIYPGMNAYIEQSVPAGEATPSEADSKMEVTELGKEKAQGHDCVKNKVVVTDADGSKHESTVWNAPDLKKFPVKIHSAENGKEVVMAFKEVKLEKPEASQFEPPAGFTKYNSFMALMQAEMMKRMGGGGFGPPPGQ